MGASLRLRSVVPLRRWRLEVDDDGLWIHASSLVEPWLIPRSSLCCISLRLAEDGAYEWPYPDEDLVRTPSRANPHAAYALGPTVQLWLAPPAPAPPFRHPLVRVGPPEPAGDIDQVELPLPTRRAVEFFDLLGVPLVASYMEAAARTVGLRPVEVPSTAAELAAYADGLAAWRHRRLGRVRSARVLLVACVALFVATIAFVPSGTGRWQHVALYSALGSFLAAQLFVPVVLREVRHVRTRRLVDRTLGPR